jgi:hypothetical protein
MKVSFKTGELYKFTEPGEDLAIEIDYVRWFQNLKFDSFGYYTYQSWMECAYVPVNTGTIALCLGTDTLSITSSNLKDILHEPYYRLLIDNKIVILLQKEKNLYSYELLKW